MFSSQDMGIFSQAKRVSQSRLNIHIEDLDGTGPDSDYHPPDFFSLSAARLACTRAKVTDCQGHANFSFFSPASQPFSEKRTCQHSPAAWSSWAACQRPRPPSSSGCWTWEAWYLLLSEKKNQIYT